MGEGEATPRHNISAKERITLKSTIHCLLWGEGGGSGNNSRIFAFREGCSNLTPRKRGMSPHSTFLHTADVSRST